MAIGVCTVIDLLWIFTISMILYLPFTGLYAAIESCDDYCITNGLICERNNQRILQYISHNMSQQLILNAYKLCRNDATALQRNSSNGCYSYGNVSKMECDADLPDSTEKICYCVQAGKIILYNTLLTLFRMERGKYYPATIYWSKST